MKITPRFRFRQFDLDHHCSSMKVGSDAMLLGAWCPVSGSEEKVLDVGSGCGILSLMLAQRLPHAKILGIDIHTPSVVESQGNAQRSPWSENISFIREDITAFASPEHFHLIVSNPPYFSSLKPSTKSRTFARHQDSLSITQLTTCVVRLLDPSGRFALVIPVSQAEYWMSEAEQRGLHPCELMTVTHKADKKPKRLLMAFSLSNGPCKSSEMIIGTDQCRTEAYTKLMSPFLPS